MAIYQPIQINIPTGLDELGIHLGLLRIDRESLYNYQKRLILESRQPTGPTEIEYLRSLARKVGGADHPVFRIDLKRDANGVPLADDAWINITSSSFKAYSDRRADVIDVEIDFYNRSNGYFLRDLYAAVTASSFFSIEILDIDYEFKLSQKLRFSNSDVHVPSELLLLSTSNKLSNENIVSFMPETRAVFLREKNSLVNVLIPGDYYIDYHNGVLFSYDIQGSFVSYTYRKFPYDVYYQLVKAYPYNDIDKKAFHKDTLISDETGLEENVLLNSEGAKIANSVIAVHPLNWGE